MSSEHGRICWGSALRPEPVEDGLSKRLLTAMYGLFLWGPETRLPVRIVAGGPLAEGVVDGDLWLEGVHPALASETELWTGARAVARQGVRAIRGQVFWEPGHLRLPRMEQQLRWLGIEVGTAPAGSPPGNGSLIDYWESQPLGTVLSRDLGLLAGIWDSIDEIRPMLPRLSHGRCRVPEAYPRLAAEEQLELFLQGLDSFEIRGELARALPRLELATCPGVWRYAVVRTAKASELLGLGWPEGHGQIAFVLRASPPLANEQAEILLEFVLAEYLHSQELARLGPSSEKKIPSKRSRKHGR